MAAAAAAVRLAAAAAAALLCVWLLLAAAAGSLLVIAAEDVLQSCGSLKSLTISGRLLLLGLLFLAASSLGVAASASISTCEILTRF